MFSDLKETLKHTLVYGTANVLRKGIAFFMIPVYTHFLSPSDYGLLELLDLFLEVTLILFGARLSAALIRYYNQYENLDDKNEVFSTALIFSIVIAAVIGVFLSAFSGPLALRVLGSHGDISYIRFIALCAPFYIIAMVPDYYLLARKESIKSSAVNTFTLFFSLSLNIIFLVFMGLGIWGLLYSMLISRIVNVSILLFLVLPKIKLSFCFTKLKGMLRFGLPLVPAALGIFIIHFSDRFFVRKYCPSADLGIYSLGYKFGMMISFLLSQPFFRVWDTQRFEIAKRVDGRSVIGRMFSFYLFIMIMGGLGISIFSREVVRIMSPEQYSGAAAVIPLVTLSYIFYGVSNFTNTGIMVSYKTKYILFANLMAAIINIALNFYLITRFGVMGAAVSTVTTFLCLALFTSFFSQMIYPIPYEFKRIAIMGVVAAVAFFISTLVNYSLLPSLVIKTIIYVMVPILLVSCNFFTKDELNRAKQAFCALKERIGTKKASVSKL